MYRQSKSKQSQSPEWVKTSTADSVMTAILELPGKQCQSAEINKVRDVCIVEYKCLNQPTGLYLNRGESGWKTKIKKDLIRRDGWWVLASGGQRAPSFQAFGSIHFSLLREGSTQLEQHRIQLCPGIYSMRPGKQWLSAVFTLPWNLPFSRHLCVAEGPHLAGFFFFFVLIAKINWGFILTIWSTHSKQQQRTSFKERWKFSEFKQIKRNLWKFKYYLRWRTGEINSLVGQTGRSQCMGPRTCQGSESSPLECTGKHRTSRI